MKSKKETDMIHPSNKQGSVLLVTLLVVSLMVMVVLALTTMVRMELRKTVTMLDHIQARNNARLGAELAVARIQETLGPDQRVTAAGEILGSAVASTSKFTGVWDADPDSVTFGQPIEWLVSRAEATPFNPATFASVATNAGWPELVSARGAGGANPIEAVRAEPVEIRDGGNSVVGAFAFWVGDEGVKARVDMRDPWANDASSTNRIHSWQISQRFGIENVRLDSDLPGTRLADDFPVNQPGLDRVIQLDQLPFLNPTSSSLRSVPEILYHDLSVYSRGVLSNTADGGLRKDLSAWLNNAAPAPDAPNDTDLIFTPGDMGVGSPGPNDDFALPAWGLIRDFHDTRYDGSTPITPRIATDTTQGIHPMLSLARVGFAVEAREGQPLRLHLYPTAVLWNPYSVPIAPGLYEFGIFHRNSQVRFNFESSPDFGNPPDPLPAGWTPTWTPGLGELWLARGMFPESGSAADDNRPFAFRIRVDEPIPPGESWVFSVADAEDGDEYTGTNELVRGNHPQNTLVIDGTVNVPAGTTHVRWHPGGNVVNGGEVDAALRPAFDPGDEPAGWPDFQGLDLRDSAYQIIQRLGHGGVEAPPPQTVDAGPLGPAQPRFGMAIEAKMGSTSYLNGRWIATANYRAQLAIRTAAEPDNPVYSLFIGPSGGATNPGFLSFDDFRASSGRRVRQVVPANNTVLAEVLPDDAHLASLAQLQHVNFARLANYPGHAVGNSHASYRMDSQDIHRGLSPPGTNLGNLKTRVYDLSYGLNQALWDRYFFSTIPSSLSLSDVSDSNYNLPNSRMRFFRPEAITNAEDLTLSEGFHLAASQLLLEGAFNINSTSVEAWRALLSSANNLNYNPENRSMGAPLVNPVSRFTVPAGNASDIWAGYRSLTDAQLDQLAQNIVEEVKARGPFMSLADFINRRRLPSSSPDYAQAVKGTLQAAIDATTTGPGAVNSDAVAPFNDMSPNSTPTQGETFFFRRDLIRGNTTFDNVAPFSSSMAFAPGMVSQADILNAIGPVISARSDTFVIRSYGRSPDAGGQANATAYCEVVVQRIPDYLDTDINPDPTSDPTGVNAIFGRRFVILSFRWITPN
jgi:hypothetical protein